MCLDLFCSLNDICFLFTGDAIFARPASVRDDDNPDPIHDMAKGWMVDAHTVERILPGSVVRMKEAFDHFLGPRDARSPGKPTRNYKAPPTGGTAFERLSTSITPNSKGERCFPTAVSLQTPRSGLAQPASNLCITDVVDPDLVPSFNKVCMSIKSQLLHLSLTLILYYFRLHASLLAFLLASAPASCWIHWKSVRM